LNRFNWQAILWLTAALISGLAGLYLIDKVYQHLLYVFPMFLACGVCYFCCQKAISLNRSGVEKDERA
jgi:hypothetical protein